MDCVLCYCGSYGYFGLDLRVIGCSLGLSWTWIWMLSGLQISQNESKSDSHLHQRFSVHS